MNRTIDRRLAALEARLIKRAVVTKPSVEGFDFDEYQRLMVEVTSHDGWVSEWTTHCRELVREHEGEQKVLIFGKGWGFYESH